MVANLLTSARRWVDRVVFNRSPLDRLSAWELERKSDKISQKRDEHKERMEAVKAEYEAKMEEAVSAEGHELQEIKAEASWLLDQYERFRRQWAGMMQAEQWLQQMMLGKNASESGVPDILQELGVDPANVEEIGKEVERAVKDEEERARKRGFQAGKIQEAYQGGGQAMESISDERVDEAVEAVRGGEEVPQIDSLVDSQSVDAGVAPTRDTSGVEHTE
ncbi:hypothetical protein [Halobaculum rubrum]|uniref:hypothetical protein n=1 Tax=Halobaculum rubrum TaxID=2872158 RepID=UPI001CA44A87|nr:hypothetical protein [Halobaculum rubrum]QZY01155.1 hypothetical protein K6T25_15310 [Halobaculum rubrum]